MDGLEAARGGVIDGLSIDRSMLPLKLDPGRRRRVEILCVGAHCDDMRLAEERPVNVSWAIMSSTRSRAAEAHKSGTLFLRAARARRVQVAGFRDGFLPAQWSELKECFEGLKRLPRPDLIFTHERDDRHQDHRIVCELTWNTFRDHLILEYEIPKYDGGMGQPNLYVPVRSTLAERKSRYLLAAYESQRAKPWFSAETFHALMRLRGVESNAGDGLAEAFYARKTIL
jgi:LmbE family N-acetylglucosaminyl deacetylase